MSAEISNNSKNVETLNRTVYILVGTIQREYPGINISVYIQASTLHNIPINITVLGLTNITKSTPKTGKLFLLKNMGFTQEQASSVFKQSKSQND